MSAVAAGDQVKMEGRDAGDDGRLLAAMADECWRIEKLRLCAACLAAGVSVFYTASLVLERLLEKPARVA